VQGVVPTGRARAYVAQTLALLEPQTRRVAGKRTEASTESNAVATLQVSASCVHCMAENFDLLGRWPWTRCLSPCQPHGQATLSHCSHTTTHARPRSPDGLARDSLRTPMGECLCSVTDNDDLDTIVVA
jgi:hypothetical protein